MLCACMCFTLWSAGWRGEHVTRGERERDAHKHTYTVTHTHTHTFRWRDRDRGEGTWQSLPGIRIALDRGPYVDVG